MRAGRGFRRLIALGVVIGGLTVFYHWTQEPISGSVTNPALLPQTTESAGPTVEIYQNKYLALKYLTDTGPWWFRLEEFDVGNIVMRVRGTSRNGPLHTLAILAQTTEDSLDVQSGVHSRRNRPEQYQEEAIKVAGESGLLFKNMSGANFERVVFFLHRGRAYSVSLTVAIVGDETVYDEQFQFILGNIILQD